MSTTTFLAAAGAALLLSAGLAGSASSQGFMGIGGDAQALGALNEMSMGFGNACMMGDQQGCGFYQYVQNLGGYLYTTGQGCAQGDQQGCNAYFNAYAELDQSYGQYQYSGYAQMAMMQPPQMPDPNAGGMAMAGGVNPLGETHEMRMQNIQNWGQQMIANGNASSAAMDAQHEAFMQTLRN